MARKKIIGFEDGNFGYPVFTKSGIQAEIVSTADTDFDGNYYASLLDDTAFLSVDTDPLVHPWISFLVTIPSHPYFIQTIFQAEAASGDKISLVVVWSPGGVGTLKVYGSAGLLATGTHSITPDEVLRLSTYLNFADEGRIIVKLTSWFDSGQTFNNVIDINFTGDTTFGSGSSSVIKFTWGEFAVEGHGDNLASGLDNIIIDDSDEIGNSHICALVPTSQGINHDWTPSVGSNWDCVDEIPASLDDFVSGDSVMTDDNLLSNLSLSNITIKSVQVQALVAKVGIPTYTTVQLGVKTNSESNISGTDQPTDSPTTIMRLLEINPVTENPWTEEEVNNLELIYKSAA